MKVSPAFTGLSAFPPSFDGHALTYMWAVFGLLLLELLALEWLWRIAIGIATEWRDRRVRHPITINRLILAMLLLVPILAVGPDLYLLMRWPELTPAGREAVAMLDRQVDGALWLPLAAAWLLSMLAGPMIDYQLIREPLPINLWPKRSQLVRPVKIVAGVFALAFAVTFLR